MYPHFTFLNHSISLWGVVGLFATTFCWVLLYYRNKSTGYNGFTLAMFLIHGIPIGLFGAYATNAVITALTSSQLNSQFSGMTVSGSILFCLIYAYLFAKFKLKVPPLKFLDDIAFTFPLSILIGRFACLLVGCCFGHASPETIESTLFTLSVASYHLDTPAALYYQNQGLNSEAQVWNLPLLFIISSTVILIVTEYLYRHKKQLKLTHGVVFLTSAVGYTFARFLIEFARAEQKVGNSLFNPWQLFILLLFFIALYWLIKTIKVPQQH